jgi:Asp-tRNA(Asn)/Glu-tRNA(Gln) amidotransferase A subunit family amidase
VNVPTFEEALRNIERREPEVNAFVRTRIPDARRDAVARAAEPPRSPLHGLPYSLKDMWDTAGMITTGGSYRYRERVPAESSPVYRVFEDAGAVLVGKTNLSDLGMASESDSWVAGTTKNPHDPKRTAGGSSGGSAASVATRMAAFDWGSDFGGSIRLPAAYCGVYGMRLSSETWPVVGMFPDAHGEVRYMNGQGPLAESLPMLKTVLDVAAPVLRTGPSRRFVLRGAVLFSGQGLAGGFWQSFAADVAGAVAAAAGDLRPAAGLPSPLRAMATAFGMYAAHFEELASSDPLGLREGIVAGLSAIVLRGRLGDRRLHPRSAEALANIALLRLALSGRTSAARREGRHLRDDVGAVWDKGLLVVSPASVFPAPRHGWSNANLLNWCYSTPFNVADATGLAVPWGRFPNGLPRALQILGPPGSEAVLVEVAERLAARAP